MDVFLKVILPVFFVIGAGYLSVWHKWLNAKNMDSLTTFAQNFAIPCLLFYVMAKIEIGEYFNLWLLVSFYISALACFIIGFLAAYFYFNRDMEESICIGFTCLFSNSILLGLPIMENAHGPTSLGSNYAIIAFHAPFCYLIGILTMELSRESNRALNLKNSLVHIFNSIFRNPLIVAILAGLLLNILGLPIPSSISSGLSIIKEAALPTALFALGGVLYQYRPEGDSLAVCFIIFVSIILHPALVYFLSISSSLTVDQIRSAVITAAMAPGINAFLFASAYKKAQPVVASSIFLGTIATVFTASIWILVLG